MQIFGSQKCENAKILHLWSAKNCLFWFKNIFKGLYEEHKIKKWRHKNADNVASRQKIGCPSAFVWGEGTRQGQYCLTEMRCFADNNGSVQEVLNKVHYYPDRPPYEQIPYQGDYCLSRLHLIHVQEVGRGNSSLSTTYTAHIQRDYLDWSLSKKELIHLNSLSAKLSLIY